MKSGVLGLICSSSYISYHKGIAKHIGVNEAIVYGNLASIQDLHGEDFFYEQGRIMQDTCLSERLVRLAVKKLADVGLIEVKKKGVPAKYHYTLSAKRLLELLESDFSGVKSDTTRSVKNKTTRHMKTDTTISNNQNIKNKVINNKFNKGCFASKHNYLSSYEFDTTCFSKEETLQVFNYFYEQYEQTFNTEHPRIKREQFTNLLSNINYIYNTQDESENMIEDLTVEDYKLMIDKYFETFAFSGAVDCNINHFWSVRELRYYERAK